MSHARRNTVLGLFAVLCLTPLFMMLKHRERWPFSDYHMYSSLAQAEFDYVLVIGETTDGQLVDLSFSDGNRTELLHPFEPIRLWINLQRFYLAANDDPALQHRMASAMRFLAGGYRRLVANDKWHGPTLRRIGLCYARLDASVPDLVFDRLAACKPVPDAWFAVEEGNS